MKILGNGLLARNFSFYSLKLNEKGLFFLNRGEHKTHEIFITDDPEKILSLMDLKFEDIKDVNMERFFEILLGCKYFKAKRFTEDVSEGGNLLLTTFAEYLSKIEFDPSYTKITFERIMEFFGDDALIEKIYKSTIVLNKEFKPVAKLDGNLILKYQPYYEKTRLSVTFPFFMKNAFPDEIELAYFLKTAKEEELVNKFIEITAGA